MNVRLNEPALRLLLGTPEGPIGREMQRRADEVVTLARKNVDFIMHGVPFSVSNAIDSAQREDGSVVVGIRFEGRMTGYLADKEADERVWLVPALAGQELV